MDELKKRLERILEQDYGIRTQEELEKAIAQMKGPDLGIFTARPRKAKSA